MGHTISVYVSADTKDKLYRLAKHLKAKNISKMLAEMIEDYINKFEVEGVDLESKSIEQPNQGATI